MTINRTTDREVFANAYGVHVKDSYELVKMAKKPIHHTELGKSKINERLIEGKDGNFYGVNYNYPAVQIDLSQLQPLLDQLVESEKPYDKERFKNFQMDMSPENYKNWYYGTHSKDCHDMIYLNDSLTEIIGFGRVCESSVNEKHKYLYVYNFVVSDKYRGKGIGKNMLMRFENIAFNNKCDYIILSCYRVNKAIKLYKSLGFNEIKGYNELWEQ